MLCLGVSEQKAIDKADNFSCFGCIDLLNKRILLFVVLMILSVSFLIRVISEKNFIFIGCLNLILLP